MKQERVTIIAELGINHLGNIEIAKQMIDGAKECGADLIKLQKREINRVYSQEELDKPRESPFGTTNRKLKEQLEFDENEWNILVDYTRKKGLDIFASAWDLDSVKFLEKYELRE